MRKRIFTRDKKTAETGRKKSYWLKYSHLVFVLLSTIAFLIFLFTIVIALVGERIIERNIYQAEQNSLRNSSYSVNLMSNLSKTLAAELLSDPSLIGLFFYENQDPVETYRRLLAFDKYRNISPYIHSLYIYNNLEDTFYITSGLQTAMIQAAADFYDQDVIRRISLADIFNTSVPVSRLLKTASDRCEQIFSFFYSFHGKKNVGKSAALVINISQSWLNDILTSLDNTSNNRIIILDGDGTLLVDSGAGSRNTDLAPVIAFVMAGKSAARHVFSTDEENVLLISYDLAGIGWKFVKIIPYRIVMKELFTFRRSLLVLSALVFIIGIVSSLILSRSLYKPIVDLKSLKQQQFTRIKQHTLTRFLHQDVIPVADETDELKAAFSLKLDFSGPIGIMMVRCWNPEFKREHGDLQQSCEKAFNDSDFPGGSAEFIIESENRIVILYNPVLTGTGGAKPSAQPEISNTAGLYRLLAAALTADITLYIGPLIYDYRDLPRFYQRLIEIEPYRILCDQNPIIYFEDIDWELHDNFVFPTAKVEDLIGVLENNNPEKVRELFDDIFRQAARAGYKPLLSTLNSIVFAVNKLVGRIRENSFASIDFDCYHFLDRIRLADSTADLRECFDDLFARIGRSAVRQSDQNPTIQEIKRIIAAEYPDINLSVSSLADRLGFSPGYLGHIFSRYAGKSLPNYINETRIEKARELLTDTDLSTREIYRRTGFTNKSHFYSTFRKYMLVTPKEYRMKKRAELMR